MRYLKMVKMLIISFLLFASCTKKINKKKITTTEVKKINSWQISPHLICGIYDFKGKLVVSDSKFRIILRDKTTARLEYLVLGGDVDRRLEKLDTQVNVRVYVPLEIKDQSRPVVFIKEFLPYDRDSPDYKFIEQRECKLASEFKII